MTEWIGGMALITIFISLLKRTTSKIFAKVKGFERSRSVEATKITKQMFLIYTTITVIGFLSLILLGGLDPFDALNHALTAISTGGFSTKNLGVFYFDQSTVFNPTAIELTLTIMSIVGMISLVLLTGLLFRERKKKVLMITYRSDIKELKVMLLGILIGTSILLWLFVSNLGLPLFTAIRKSLFHTVTAMSGTGYNAMDLSYWKGGEKLVVLFLSIMGGSAWSAAGALKLIRVHSLLSFIQKIPKVISRHERIEIDDNNKEAFTYIVMFMVVLGGGMLVLYPFLSNYSFLDVFYQVVCALGNTGPQILNVSQIHFIGKFFFIILMILGYLEILPIINLIKLIIATVKSNTSKA
jgi:trk system potassium uptake protein TrkH